MPRRATYGSFGTSVSNSLADNQMTQTELAASLKTSVSYVHQMMTSYRAASPKWTNLVADVLKMSQDQRADLHARAAKDAGYKFDLTPSKKNRR